MQTAPVQRSRKFSSMPLLRVSSSFTCEVRASLSAQAAVTGYDRLGVFNTRHSFLTGSGGWRPKIKVPAASVPGLQKAVFDCVLTWWRAEREATHRLLF